MPETRPKNSSARLLAGVEDICRRHGCRLLYLTRFGSDLYGTGRPNKSDLDLRGIFTVDEKNLVLGYDRRSIHESTGSAGRRNQADDVDIDLWSLRYWLKLLAEGDIGALDLIFSPSNKEAVIYSHPLLDPVFERPLDLLNTAESRAYALYSLGQAKKYGIKGSRLGAIRAVNQWLQKQPAAPGERLEAHLETLVQICDDENFCRPAQAQNLPALYLGGKIYIGRLKLSDFAKLVEAEMKRYGERAKEAEANQGLDFKALSHAIRALDQMAELYESGRVVFPLKNRAEIMAVKEGRFNWPEMEKMILSRLATVERLQKESRRVGRHDENFARQCLLACYGLNSGPKPEPGRSIEKGFEIEPEVLQAIDFRLDEIEKQSGVAILYACESGSRGWGFASPDSDYDVRFIYLRPRDRYLALNPGRDVIECDLADCRGSLLDINGWDLKKALKLFKSSNSTLLEWLSSPVVYRDRLGLAEALRQRAGRALNPLRSWHNYHGIVQGRLKNKNLAELSAKGWFYVLRPLLAMKWLEAGLGPAPMRFDRLLAETVGPGPLMDEITKMVRLKASAGEASGFTAPPAVLEFVAGELAGLKARAESLPKKAAGPLPSKELDDIFQNLLNLAEEGRNSGGCFCPAD